MIAIIAMFFTGVSGGLGQSLLSAVLLTAIILLGIVATFVVSGLLSKTVLQGMPSAFTLELPPYRKPQFGKVILRSWLDRTIFVLLRAVSVAAPAGLIIWLTANVTVNGHTLLSIFAGWLDPFARLLGLDGVILLAFILGFPANEIVIPLMIMAYMAQGSLLDIADLSLLRQLLTDNEWTWATAISVMLFSLMHWPCSTTLLTIKKETQSIKWTAIALLTPTLIGFAICFLFNAFVRLLSLV